MAAGLAIGAGDFATTGLVVAATVATCVTGGETTTGFRAASAMARCSGGFAMLETTGAVLVAAGSVRLAGFAEAAAVGDTVGAVDAAVDLYCGAVRAGSACFAATVLSDAAFAGGDAVAFAAIAGATVFGVIATTATGEVLGCGAVRAGSTGFAATGLSATALAATVATAGLGDGVAGAGSTDFTTAFGLAAVTAADFAGISPGAGAPADAVKVVPETVDIAEAVASDAVAGELANTSKAVSARRTSFGKVLIGLPRVCASIMAASIRGKFDHSKQKFCGTCRAL